MILLFLIIVVILSIKEFGIIKGPFIYFLSMVLSIMITLDIEFLTTEHHIYLSFLINCTAVYINSVRREKIMLFNSLSTEEQKTVLQSASEAKGIIARQKWQKELNAYQDRGGDVIE